MAKHSVVFFDGVCNLCNAAVQFIIKRDKKQRFKFAALQSRYAEETLIAKVPSLKHGDSILLLENAEVFEQSTAALRIARQ